MNDSSLSLLTTNVVLNYLMGVELVFGLAVNLLILVICSRKKLRAVPTFVFIWFIAYSNFGHLIIVSLTSFINQVLQLNWEINNWTWCRLCTLFKLTSFQWNSWMIAAMTLEVYLSVRIRNFRQKYSTMTKTGFICSLLGLCLFVLNCSVMGLHDIRLSLANTSVTERIMLCLSPFSIKEYYAQLSMVMLFNFFYTVIFINCLTYF